MSSFFGNLRAVTDKPLSCPVTLRILLLLLNTFLYKYIFFQSHTMRVAVCEVLGEALVQVLCGDGLDDAGKADRDRFLDTIQEHIHDTHSHVRTRVLQVYTRIVNSKVCLPDRPGVTDLSETSTQAPGTMLVTPVMDRDVKLLL